MFVGVIAKYLLFLKAGNFLNEFFSKLALDAVNR
jgi:hypothetical protein